LFSTSEIQRLRNPFQTFARRSKKPIHSPVSRPSFEGSGARFRFTLHRAFGPGQPRVRPARRGIATTRKPFRAYPAEQIRARRPLSLVVEPGLPRAAAAIPAIEAAKERAAEDHRGMDDEGDEERFERYAPKR